MSPFEIGVDGGRHLVFWRPTRSGAEFDDIRRSYHGGRGDATATDGVEVLPPPTTGDWYHYDQDYLTSELADRLRFIGDELDQHYGSRGDGAAAAAGSSAAARLCVAAVNAVSRVVMDTTTRAARRACGGGNSRFWWTMAAATIASAIGYEVDVTVIFPSCCRRNTSTSSSLSTSPAPPSTTSVAHRTT